MDIYRIEAYEDFVKDLDEIFNFISEYNNKESAFIFIKDIKNNIEKNLCFFPYRNEKYGNFHMHIYKKYLIFYEVDAKDKIVRLVLISHSKRFNKYKHLFE